MQARILWRYWIYPLLPLFFLGVWYTGQKAAVRVLPISVALLLILLLCMTWPVQPPYASGGYAAALAMMIFGLRFVRPWRINGKKLGLALTRSVVVTVALLCLMRAGLALVDGHGVVNLGRSPLTVERKRIESQLEQMPGSHLVIVYYRRGHGSEEWVYNSANIDRQRVVWARNMGTIRNQELLTYYKNRQVWVVDPDEYPLRLHPYSVVAGHLDQDLGLEPPALGFLRATLTLSDSNKKYGD